MERGPLNSKTCGELQEDRESAANGVNVGNCVLLYKTADSQVLMPMP